MNWGIIGSNYIAEWFVQSGNFLKDFHVRAVYSRTMKRAKEFGASQGADLFFDDIDAFANEKSIDAVYIASPTYCHKNHTIKMLEAKKHVLCEKPVSANEREFIAMQQAAKDNGVLFMEALRTLFMPEFQLIQEGMKKLGTIRRVCINYCQYSGRYDNFRDGLIENAFKPELCNGALMDIGVYAVNAVALLLGMPKTIYGATVKLHNGIDGQGTIVLNYGDKQAEIIYSKITWGANRSQIMGEDGYMVIENITHPKTIDIYYNDGSHENIPFAITPDEKRLMDEIALFTRLVKENGSADAYNKRTQIAMKIMDKARKDMEIIFPNDLE